VTIEKITERNAYGKPEVSTYIVDAVGQSVAYVNEQWVLWEGNDEESTTAVDAATITSSQASCDAALASWNLTVLRRVRDELLAETDWWASSDLTMTAEQTAYRQSLRDLPSDFPNATVADDFTWTNVTFPTKP